MHGQITVESTSMPDDVHRAAAAAESNRREHVRNDNIVPIDTNYGLPLPTVTQRNSFDKKPPDDVRGQRRFGDHEFRG